MESRKHEKKAPEESAPPDTDIHVTEKMLRDNEPLLAYLSSAVLSSALATPGAVDFDVREALEGLVRTYRTLQSGVYYESRPSNPLAGAVYGAVQEAAAQFRREEQQHLGMTRTRDSDVLAMLVFLAYFERDRNNGRKRGRAFLDALREFYVAPTESPKESGPSLLLP